MKANLLCLFVFLCVFCACHPKAIVKIVQTREPVQDFEPFAIITEMDTVDLSGALILADIQLRNEGMQINCTYDNLVFLASQKAKKLGANALRIYEHRPPGVWNGCDQIKAKALFLTDAKAYERKIAWHEKRKLIKSDFKGSTIDRPFVAATSSNFTYRSWVDPSERSNTIIVDTYFDCNASYFKNTDDSTVLGHEQVHFDITELFARKFVKKINDEIKTTKEFNERVGKAMSETYQEIRLLQDKYDSDVYVNRNRQQFWSDTISNELHKMDAYKNKQVSIKI